MSMFRFNRMGSLALAAMSLSLAGCSFAAKNVEEQSLNNVSLQYEEVSRMAYMGGSVFYNPKAPKEGQIFEGTKVAVRFGKVEKVKADTEEQVADYETYRNIADSEEFGYVTVNTIDEESINITYSEINEKGTGVVKTLTLKNGEEADINGDKLPDVKYASPATVRAGFEKAVYLTFISSQDDLYTSMFSVIPEQYSRNAYPSGVMGINPDGKFIVTKYESESNVRSALKGVANGDYVLDNQTGKYGRVAKASNFNSARAIADEEISAEEEIPFEDILPLLAVKVGENSENTIEDGNIRAATYSQYNAERNAIETEFSNYKSYNLLSDKWKVDNVGEVYAKIGIKGTFSITWKNVESTVSAAACVKIELNPGKEEKSSGKYFEEPLKIFNWNKTIQIGVVPFSIGVDGKLDASYERYSKTDLDFCAGFIGMFGAEVKVGANYGISWFKPYINPYASHKLINRTSYFFGIKSGSTWTPYYTYNETIIPEVEITPKVGIANNTVWVGVSFIDTLKYKEYYYQNLLTKASKEETYIYNKFGMSVKAGFNLLGIEKDMILYNLTPGADFKEIYHKVK